MAAGGKAEAKAKAKARARPKPGRIFFFRSSSNSDRAVGRANEGDRGLTNASRAASREAARQRPQGTKPEGMGVSRCVDLRMGSVRAFKSQRRQQMQSSVRKRLAS